MHCTGISISIPVFFFTHDYHSEKGSLIHITNQLETQKREFNLKQRVTYLRHSKINNIKTL